MRIPLDSAYLSQDISQAPSHQARHGLGHERLLVERVIVGGPSRDGASSDFVDIAKERAVQAGGSAKGGRNGGLGSSSAQARRRVDSKGRDDDAG